MASKFDLNSFRKELSNLHAVAGVEKQKADQRAEKLGLYIRNVKDASRIVHQKLKHLDGKKPSEDDIACFEFLDKISPESRTPYEQLGDANLRNKELLSYLKELLKKIDACFERIAEKKEVSYTERNLVKNNSRRLSKASDQAVKDDTFIELFENDVVPVMERILVGL